MSRPHNTSKDNTYLKLFVSDPSGRGIEEQEAAGGREMADPACEVIPAQITHAADEELTALGFTLGPVDPDDPLFREAALPEGWTRQPSGWSTGTYLVDEHGRKRATIFYKAAHYDRKATISFHGPHVYVDECVAKGEVPVLDDTWATREQVIAALNRIAEEAHADLEELAGRDDALAKQEAAVEHKKLARVVAITGALSGTPEGT